MTQSSEKAWDRVIKPWWAKVAIGIILILISISTYSRYSKLESGEQESALVTRSTHFLYDIGGKWAAAGLPAVAGMAFIAWAIVQVSRRSEQ